MKNRIVLQKRLILFLILLSQIVMINSIIATNATQPNKTVEMNLTAEKYEFSPNKITVSVGTNLTIILHSKDRIHGFYLEGYDLTQTICNEHYFTISFIANKAGTFIFKCNEPACGPYHPYMVGSLTVTPNIQMSVQSVVILIPFIFITSSFIIKWRKSIGNR